MRPKVIIVVVVFAIVGLASVFLLPRGGASVKGVPQEGEGFAEANSASGSESKVEGLKSKVQEAKGQDVSRERRTSADGRNRYEGQDESARQSSSVAADAPAAAASSSAPNAPASGSASGGKAAQKVGQDLDEARQVAVETRVQELSDLGMEDDAKSLQTILSELSNGDAEIRKAAVEATVQFGSQDAIPELENAMLWAENAEQRQQITDAIEFLKLPKLTEAVALFPTARKKAAK